MASLEPRPIFIVGAPRTGTTLLREILTLHPRIFIHDEVHFCERVFDRHGEREVLQDEVALAAARTLLRQTRWAAATENFESSARKLVSAAGPPPVTYASMLKAYLEAEALRHGARVWGDSSPQDVLYLDTLKTWFPGARIIVSVRDPRAYLASYKKYVNKGLSDYHDRYSPFINSFLWRRYMQAALHTRSRPWRQDVYRIHYEDLVSRPDATVQDLCSFLEIEFVSDMLRVGRQNSSYFAVQQDYEANGITNESVDRWRENLSLTEQWLLERIVATPMRQLGYRPETSRLPLRFWPELFGLALRIPFRLFNLLFRTHKPLTLSKLRKVLGRNRVSHDSASL